jgi:hypothetical protein
LSFGCFSFDSVDKPRLRVSRNQDPPGDEGLVLKGDVILPRPIDPTVSGFSFRVDDDSGQPLYSRHVPGGLASPSSPGWKANNRGTRWTFRDRTGSLAGGVIRVTIADLSARTPGLHRFSLTAKNSDFQVALNEVPVRLLAQFANAADQCGRRSFNPAGGATPACSFNPRGTVLNCR